MLRYAPVFVLAFLGLLATVGGFVGGKTRDRSPDYEINLDIRMPAQPGPLRVGFAKHEINPDLEDTWTDVNGDARYDPADGDTYEDVNGNGRFDPYWLSGFHAGRPATGLHDDLRASAMVVDDGTTRVAIVAVDAMGFLHDDIVDVRRQIAKVADVDYTIVCSTHTHQAPDLVGPWGRTHASGGVNKAYLAKVRRNTAQAVVDAVAALRPARLRFAQDLDAARELVADGRDPQVFDPGIRLVQAVDAETEDTLGVLYAWADHPETMWRTNLEVSADFVHYVREGLENGVYDGERQVMPGLGGVAVYVNGAIGGLMTTNPDTPVRDPFNDTVYDEPSAAKARAQGQHLAMLGLNLLRGRGVREVAAPGISLRARTLTLPMTNTGFRMGVYLGIIDRGYTGWGHIRTEVAVLRIGPAQFLTVPGEIYPEIVNGGIEAPEGQDFALAPQELPPLRDLMDGDYNFVLGLANDAIGYIIPKSEWDEAPPYLYHADESPYGEINSIGPDTGPLLHAALAELLRAD